MTEQAARVRRRNAVLIFAVVLIMGLTMWSGTSERVPTPYFDLPAPMVIAHQGGNRLRPGNTLLAFDHAVALGVDVLEMDVHASADDVLVVIHDDTVDRTTDGSGAVRDLTLAQLHLLDAAYDWPYVAADGGVEAAHLASDPPAFPYRGQGVRIPALDEVLQRYPDMRLNIEIKPDDAAVAEALCDALIEHERGGMTLVASFHRDAMHSFRRACPGVATSASAAEARWFAYMQRLGMLGLFRAPAISLQLPMANAEANLATRELVADASKAHLYVDFWTVNDLPGIRRVMRIGAQGILSDRPDLVLDEAGRGP